MKMNPFCLFEMRENENENVNNKYIIYYTISKQMALSESMSEEHMLWLWLRIWFIFYCVCSPIIMNDRNKTNTSEASIFTANTKPHLL